MAAAPAGVESVAPLSASAYLNVPAPLVAGAPAVSTLALPRTAGTVITTSVAAKAAAAKKYANCTALNRAYPHGVGKSGAVDRVSGKTQPVKNFTRNNALYAANAKSDRDKDGIACEKR